MMKTILFLCTGNYYRSRFAEVFFNWHAEQRGLQWRSTSRGLAPDAANSGVMYHRVIDAFKTRGIPLDAYQRFPLPVLDADLQAADRIIAVKEAEHRALLGRGFPEWLDRVEFWQVHDLDCATPEETIPHLEREVLALIDRLDGNSG